MNHAIEVYDKCNDADSIKVLGEAIAYSGMFGCEKPEQGIVLALQCMAERKPPLEMAKTYHLIKGKLSKRADAMLADFRKAGGKWEWADLKNREVQSAKVEFEGRSYDLSYSIDEAKEAGLSVDKAGSNWQKFPAAMLRARLVSETLRAIAPEIVQGAYTPEEISDFSPSEIKRAEPVEQPAKPVQKPDTSDDDDIPMEHVRDRLRPKIQPHEKVVNKWLTKNNRIKDGQTWEQLSNDYLERVEKNIDAFLKACGAEVEA